MIILATSVQDIADDVEKALEADGGFDYIHIIQQTSDLGRVVGVLYGVLTTTILILVPIVVSIELMYICFPVLRVNMENLVVKVESKGIAGKVVGFTLRDARQAVFQAETAQTGRSALWIYLKMKCTSMMVVMLVIAIVLKGSESIINIVWKLIERAVFHIFP